MKKALKFSLILISIIVIILGSCAVVFAHPGKTDSAGGHYDRSSGEYHYHHGYPAHQHDNGTCPYDFKNNEKSTVNYYNYEETTTNEINSNAETETFATIIVEENTKSNNSNEIDYDSLRNKSKINDWVQEYLNNYEKLNDYYSSARKQISKNGTCDNNLYDDFVSLNNKVIASLPNYEKYIDKDKYNEIQKQTKLYKNFLDKNAPNDSEYIETTTEETTINTHSKKSDISATEKIFTVICYCFFAIYIIEVIILAIMLLIRDFKDYDFADRFFYTIVFLIYALFTFGYFSFLFSNDKNIYVLFFVYLPAPIISTYMLYTLIKDTIEEKKKSKEGD